MVLIGPGTKFAIKKCTAVFEASDSRIVSIILEARLAETLKEFISMAFKEIGLKINNISYPNFLVSYHVFFER
jgi:hypothetical protein